MAVKVRASGGSVSVADALAAKGQVQPPATAVPQATVKVGAHAGETGLVSNATLEPAVNGNGDAAAESLGQRLRRENPQREGEKDSTYGWRIHFMAKAIKEGRTEEQVRAEAKARGAENDRARRAAERAGTADNDRAVAVAANRAIAMQASGMTTSVSGVSTTIRPAVSGGNGNGSTKVTVNQTGASNQASGTNGNGHTSNGAKYPIVDGVPQMFPTNPVLQRAYGRDYRAAKDAQAKAAVTNEWEAEKAKIERPAAANNFGVPTAKVGEKGGVVVRGFGRFPLTQYISQWRRLNQYMPAILTACEDLEAKGLVKMDKSEGAVTLPASVIAKAGEYVLGTDGTCDWKPLNEASVQAQLDKNAERAAQQGSY